MSTELEVTKHRKKPGSQVTRTRRMTVRRVLNPLRDRTWLGWPIRPDSFIPMPAPEHLWAVAYEDKEHSRYPAYFAFFSTWVEAYVSANLYTQAIREGKVRAT